MKLYSVTQKYMDYMIEKNEKIVISKMTTGFVMRLNGFIYFIPLEQADQNDYEENGLIKRSTPSILRMIDQRSAQCIGKCLFSNMFPVPYKDVVTLNLSAIPQKELLEKQKEYLQQNESRLQKSAIRIYKQKIRNYDQAYLKATLDFQKMEKECLAYEAKTYGKHLNRFPDSEYFIVNPYQTGETEYYLMNQHRKIARIRMNNETQNVTAIIEIIHPEFAPLECFDHGELRASAISQWFKGRGIPSWRDGLNDFLENSGIQKEILLLNRAFGLSLSDQYWMNPVDMLLEWDDINFFQHDFNSSDFIEASFENRIKENVDFYTPNNTSEGMLKKAWIVGEDQKRYLLKGSYRHSDFEPFNEVLASWILEGINAEHAAYSLDHISSSLVSKCECFIDQDSEFISAYALLKYEDPEYQKQNEEEIYQTYISILKKHGLHHVDETLAKMFICDYLIVNEDRHLGNFGIIRNVQDLKWTKIAPVFDSGQSMYSQSAIYEINFEHAYGTFFHLKHVDYDTILKIVLKDTDITIDIKKMYEIKDAWKELLTANRKDTCITNERIDTCVKGLETRISKLEKYLRQ